MINNYNNYNDNQVINGDFYGENTNGTIADENRTGIVHAFKSFFKNYFNFSGCSNRSEFWWMQLILILYYLILSLFIILSVASYIDKILIAPSRIFKDLSSLALPLILIIIYIISAIATFIPTLALSFRRLHDTDHPGIYALFPLITLIISRILMLLCNLINPMLAISVLVLGNLVTFISNIALLVMYCQQTVPSEGNMYNNKSVNLDQYY